MDEDTTLLNLLASQSPLDEYIEDDLKEKRKVKRHRKALNMRKDHEGF
jgi:hypothetical protein